MYFWRLMIEMIPVTPLPSYSVPGGWGYSGMFWVGMCCLGVQIWTLCYKNPLKMIPKTMITSSLNSMHFVKQFLCE